MKKALLFSLVLFLVSCSNITSSSFNSEVSKSSTSSIDSHVDTEDPKPNTSSSSIDNKSYLKTIGFTPIVFLLSRQSLILIV